MQDQIYINSMLEGFPLLHLGFGINVDWSHWSFPQKKNHSHIKVSESKGPIVVDLARKIQAAGESPIFIDPAKGTICGFAGWFPKMSFGAKSAPLI